MFKTHDKSRFEVLNSQTLRTTEKIVVQIGENKLHNNKDGMAVFLCETVDPAYYKRETLEGQLEAAMEELENQTAKASAMEELAERAKDGQRKIADCLNETIDENKALLDALAECKRIFGDLPKEIESLMEGGPDNVYTGTI